MTIAEQNIRNLCIKIIAREARVAWSEAAWRWLSTPALVVWADTLTKV